MQEIPYVGIPAIRKIFPSLAPVDIVGTQGTPGHSTANVFSSAAVTSGNNGDAGTFTTGITVPSAAFCSTKSTVTLGSATTLIKVWCTCSGSSPGKIRQFTLARAVCGNALAACPPFNMVATQVVCSNEL